MENWLDDYYAQWPYDQDLIEAAEIELNTIAAQQQGDYA